MISEEIAPEGIESFVGEAVHGRVPLNSAIRLMEQEYICAALNASDGNKAEAARISGLTYQTFVRKLANLELKVSYHLR